MAEAGDIMKVVVVGAGFGGVACVQALKGACEAGRVHVTLIEAGERFTVGACYQFVLTGRVDQGAISQDLTGLVGFADTNVRVLLNTPVEKVDIASKTVLVKGGSSIPYDKLVLATGTTYCPERVPGLATSNARNCCSLADTLKLRDEVAEVPAGGTVVVSVLAMPYKCPPVPFEIAFLVEELLQARGIRDSVKIVVTVPTPSVPFAGGIVHKVFLAACKNKGVEFMPKHTCVGVESTEGKTTLRFKDKDSIVADVVAAVYPQAVHAPFRPLANKLGLLSTDPGSMRAQVDPSSVYAVGDCNLMLLTRKNPKGETIQKPHPKAGHFAYVCGTAVGQQIELCSTGKTADEAAAAVPPAGRQGRCFVESGHGKAILMQAKLFADAEGPFGFHSEAPASEYYHAKQTWINSHLTRMFGKNARPLVVREEGGEEAAATSME